MNLKLVSTVVKDSHRQSNKSRYTPLFAYDHILAFATERTFKTVCTLPQYERQSLEMG